MEPRTVEQVESWSTRSVADGYAGLRELSDGEFSGAVRGSGAWLFMLNGRIVGIFEGTLDDFENTDGTAYAAPHPSLPLLFSMQEQGGDTRAKYYTNDTPLSEVDKTLSEGKFTGFVELSENVLSGDYYVAYYGGRSLSVAFVGASEQVVTGDEAFERADDEVGIYEVTDVDVTITDVPEPDDDAGGASGGGQTSGRASGGAASGGGATAGAAGGASPASGSESRDDAGGASSSTSNTDSSTTDHSPSAGSGGASGSRPTDSSDLGESPDDDSPASETGTETPTSRGEASTAERSRTPDVGRTTDDASSATTDATATGRAESTPDRNGPAATRSEPTPDRTASTRDADATEDASASATTESSGPTEDASASAGDSPTETEAGSVGSEAEWRETTTIPSLDPDLSDDVAASSSEAQASATTAGPDQRPVSEPEGPARSGRRSSRQPSSGSGASEASTSESGASDGDSDESDDARERIRTLRKQLGQRKQQVEQLKERLSTLESERNEYKRERDALSQEVERLEAELEGSSSAEGSAVGRQLSESDAFAGTNLFVRYDSKGEATLDEAAKGQVDRSDVNANLRLEHHTQFEAGEANVDGEPFETFLTGSFEYQFASWVVEELLYEIRDTGKRNGLKELYGAIPKIDRVDLHGTVSAGDDREDTRQEAFDVIMRDRMGEPLVVADLNDSRDPTTGEMMGSLVDAGSGVAQAHDGLAGAFQVTASFFEPEALETAEAATSGGLLSREKRASFVKLSRKRGYHLCLVESRGGDFHLNVPEL